jgi:Second Messenger Oligonucleotide or Dinucleotide Synthetase domain
MARLADSSIEREFRSFDSSIRLTKGDRRAIRNRLDALHLGYSDRLGWMFQGRVRHVKSIHFGSAARETAIRPLQDIDVLFVLRLQPERSSFPLAPQFIQKVAGALSPRPHAMGHPHKGKFKGQAVRLTFEKPPHVDVVPAILDRKGRMHVLSDSGGWQRTNALLFDAYVKRRDIELSGRFRPLIRFMREWNRNQQAGIGSYLLDRLVERFIKANEQYSQAILDILGGMQELLTSSSESSIEDQFSTSFVGSRRQLLTALASSHKLARNAVQAEREEHDQYAIRCWRTLFGDRFPEY